MTKENGQKTAQYQTNQGEYTVERFYSDSKALKDVIAEYLLKKCGVPKEP